MLEVLPTAEALGPGWSREITFLFDPASQPSELFGGTSKLPDAFKQQNREAIENPTNLLSGWSHTHFTFKSAKTSRHYEVQIERYRSDYQLEADFNNLLAFDSAEYRRLPIDGLGDAAVLFRNAAMLCPSREDLARRVAPAGPGRHRARGRSRSSSQ